MCRVFGVTRSWYYALFKRGATKRQHSDNRLLVQVKTAFEESDKTYGAGRIMEELRDQGTFVGKNRI
jgi:putative transposase